MTRGGGGRGTKQSTGVVLYVIRPSSSSIPPSPSLLSLDQKNFLDSYPSYLVKTLQFERQFPPLNGLRGPRVCFVLFFILSFSPPPFLTFHHATSTQHLNPISISFPFPFLSLIHTSPWAYKATNIKVLEAETGVIPLDIHFESKGRPKMWGSHLPSKRKNKQQAKGSKGEEEPARGHPNVCQRHMGQRHYGKIARRSARDDPAREPGLAT